MHSAFGHIGFGTTASITSVSSLMKHIYHLYDFLRGKKMDEINLQANGKISEIFLRNVPKLKF